MSSAPRGRSGAAIVPRGSGARPVRAVQVEDLSGGDSAGTGSSYPVKDRAPGSCFDPLSKRSRYGLPSVATYTVLRTEPSVSYRVNAGLPSTVVALPRVTFVGASSPLPPASSSSLSRSQNPAISFASAPSADMLVHRPASSDTRASVSACGSPLLWARRNRSSYFR